MATDPTGVGLVVFESHEAFRQWLGSSPNKCEGRSDQSFLLPVLDSSAYQALLIGDQVRLLVEMFEEVAGDFEQCAKLRPSFLFIGMTERGPTAVAIVAKQQCKVQKENDVTSYLLTPELVAVAIEMVRPQIIALMDKESADGLHIVVCDPIDGSIIGERSFNDQITWRYPYERIAASKAEVVMNSGMSSHTVQQLYPHLYEVGNVVYAGAVVYERYHRRDKRSSLVSG